MAAGSTPYRVWRLGVAATTASTHREVHFLLYKLLVFSPWTVPKLSRQWTSGLRRVVFLACLVPRTFLATHRFPSASATVGRRLNTQKLWAGLWSAKVAEEILLAVGQRDRGRLLRQREPHAGAWLAAFPCEALGPSGWGHTLLIKSLDSCLSSTWAGRFYTKKRRAAHVKTVANPLMSLRTTR